MHIPDISEAYRLALELDNERGGGVLDEESISEEIDEGNKEFLSDASEFNSIVASLRKALISDDIKQQDKELVTLKVYAMNLVTTFSNLNDELEKLVKAYAFLDERESK
jgi:hypothetical protein